MPTSPSAHDRARGPAHDPTHDATAADAADGHADVTSADGRDGTFGQRPRDGAADRDRGGAQPASPTPTSESAKLPTGG